MDSSPSSSPDWAILDEALDAALDLDGAERDAYVASLDLSLRTALVPLLRDALAMDPILDHPEVVLETLAVVPEQVEVGALIGPYRLEALVGEGGMGRVYRARRADGAFDKTVAVKVVRQALTLAGSDVSARLRRERDLLAALDHPGIAQLIDGGETADGVPYLVTEFVDGAPVTDWADDHHLDLPARVRLMVAVARAVDHAHRRFVVHRDIKPSNVLVTERDGVPRPVVLDFGIAKLLEATDDSTGAFPLTRTGMRLLTPAYAAPELYEPTTTITTAADVYGLGALLYEVLTGHRPHADVPSVGPPTMEPTRPSRVVTGSAPGQAFDADRRSRTLRGDLDTICLKALHPDPARRYRTAAHLADDLVRYLDGHPVEARPDGWAYVVGRFVRRHRSMVAAAAVAVLALVGGLGASLAALAYEREARAEAEAATERAEGAADFLADLFDSANAESNGGEAPTVPEVLDEAAARVADVEPAALQGYLYALIGEVYLHSGQESRAESLLVRAVDVLSYPGAPVETRALALYNHGRMLGFRHEHAAAADGFRQALSLLTADHSTRLRFDLTRDLSWVLRETGDIEGATVAAEAAVSLARNGMARRNLPFALWELGMTADVDGRLADAEAALREMVAIHEDEQGPDHPMTAVSLPVLAHILERTGQPEEADRLRSRAHNVFVEAFGSDHTRTMENLVERAYTRITLGRPQAAARDLDTTLAIATRILDHNDRRWGLVGLRGAAAWSRLGRHAEAERLARAALRVAAVHEDPLEQARAEAAVADALLGQSRTDAGRRHLERALASFDAARVTGEEPTRVRATLRALGSVQSASVNARSR